jgi:hypothetical protein
MNIVLTGVTLTLNGREVEDAMLQYWPTPEHVASKQERPDPEWRFVDNAGHVHTYDRHGFASTLTFVVDRVSGYDEDGEPIEDGHFACAICGQAVAPGFKRAGPPQSVASTKWLVSATVDAFGAEPVRVRYDGVKRGLEGEAFVAHATPLGNGAAFVELVGSGPLREVER